MYIRRFENQDAAEVSTLIIKTLKITNSKDYTKSYIEDFEKRLKPVNMIETGKSTHFYVVVDSNKIIGCGAIGPCDNRIDEACLYKIFVDPLYQARGVGRKIMDTIEKDPYYLRAKRIEVPASITAIPFYLKLGYSYKDGNKELDENLLVILEKTKPSV